MTQFVPVLLNALTLISILMLVALGLAVIFGLMNIINLAHGEFVTIGAYTLALTQAMGGNYWLALAVAPFVGAALGLTVEWTMVRHLYRRPLAVILATWGLGMVLQQGLQIIFGAAPQRVAGPLSGAVEIFGAPYPAYRLLLIGFAIAIVLACYAGFRWTRFGLDLRAVIQDRDMAAALGIDTGRVYSLAFALGAAIAAVAGVLIAPLTVVIAQMGINYLARSFFVVIVGGVGGIGGVAAGSAVVGGTESLLNYQVPVTVSQALVLVLAIVIVRFRPRGLVPL
ncbi:urea ABC transporter permease subunit UrtB [Rhodoligotrophos defluvii]|uniref:urea ABC transporter permease subunit UrtB n=1 Tax=Rhodoligotrophos defluvii TaxID=2561934 RepID=UPI001EF069A3|nr:urea ABC transporter permease subunit UrtB [Rhodoligotrophos defluvii]